MKAIYVAQQQRFLASTSSNIAIQYQKPLATSRAFKIPKVPTKQSRTKQTQPYRTKTQTQSFVSSNRKDFTKRSSNFKQFPSSKIAWKPTLSTASLTEWTFQWGKIGPLCGTLGKIDRQQMGPLCHSKWFQDTIQVNSSPIVSSNKTEPIFLTVTSKRDWYPSPETGSGKGTRFGNSPLLLPAIPCTKKEWKVTSSYRSFFTEPIHKETTIQDGDSQVRKTVDCEQLLGCLHRLDRCLSSCSDASSNQKVSSIRLRRSDIPVHGLTLRNVCKSMDFYQIDGRYSIAPASTCHFSFSVPRQLAGKKSDSKPTNRSDKILPSSSSESRFYSKPKKVRIYSSSEFHIHRHGISDTAEFSQGTSGTSRESNFDCQICSLLQSSIGTNFPFSFGQTQCSSRFCSPRQTSFLTPANVSSVCLETSYSSSRSSDYDQQYDRFHLKWWMDTKRFILGIHPPDPNVFLFTDASHLGWGTF